MTNLLNKFVCVGVLNECRIDLFPTHARCKMTIKILDNLLTIYYSVNRKYHEEAYDNLKNMIPNLHPKSNGYVWVNGEKYYELSSGETWVFCSGNMNEKYDRLFYSAEYLTLAKTREAGLNIFMQGIWTKYGFMNVLSDSPRIFRFSNRQKSSQDIYTIYLENVVKEKCDRDTIETLEKCDNLCIKNIEKCDKILKEKDIDNWLLEWEIMNEN